MASESAYKQVPILSNDSHLVTAETAIQCRVYKRRWLMLAIFVLYSFANSYQWIQYAIVANVIVRYYGVSSYAVDWTAIIFLLTYILCIFPAFYLLKKLGLRQCLIIGALGTAVGSWIKCLSVSPDRFFVTLLGQTLVGACQVFLCSIPPELAPVWFGSDQVSTACSLGVFGNQFGIACGLLLTPLLVRNHTNLDDIGTDLSTMFYIMAALTTLAFVLTFFLFQEKPPLPPSVAAAKRTPEELSIFRGMIQLFRNKGYNYLLLSYGLSVGVLNAFLTLLNQLILIYFEDGEKFAGRLGLVFIVSGMVGGVSCGFLLDKTHKFKETTLALYAISAVAMLVFTFILALKSQVAVYIVSALLGVSIGGYVPVGYEFASELTYPEAESTTSGLLLLSSCVLGVVFTTVYAWLLNAVGDIWANVSLFATLVLGTVLTALIPPDLKRQKAQATALDHQNTL